MDYTRILTIQDISCVGQCSLTVALPILSACGLETAILPSAVLSTHTAGFTGFTFRDLTEDMPGIQNHWKKAGIDFAALYTGYLGSAAQINQVRSIAQGSLREAEVTGVATAGDAERPGDAGDAELTGDAAGEPGCAEDAAGESGCAEDAAGESGCAGDAAGEPGSKSQSESEACCPHPRQNLASASASSAAVATPVTSASSTKISTDTVKVLLPVFPGTNSEYDMAQAFRAAGAEPEMFVIRNLNPPALADDTATFIAKLTQENTSILGFSGGFSLGDEPDGSAKFMAAFLRSPHVAAAIREFTAQGGLVLGICNGFQALVKSGFLPYGNPDLLTPESPTLTHNRQLRHVSRIATTRVHRAALHSPWLSTFVPGQIHQVPVSHGEGRFVVSPQLAQELFARNQVAFQYVDSSGQATLAAPDNPNGSDYAIEGIVSPDGRILGKMGHPERYRPGLMRNIPQIYPQDIFSNGVEYCRNRKERGL